MLKGSQLESCSFGKQTGGNGYEDHNAYRTQRHENGRDNRGEVSHGSKRDSQHVIDEGNNETGIDNFHADLTKSDKARKGRKLL